MGNYIKKFDNIEDFREQQYSNDNQYPNVSYIDTTREIKINELLLFGLEDVTAGDILMVKEDEENYGESIIGFVKRSNYKKVLENSDFKPAGVVAVPSNLTPDNTVRVMSLVNMKLMDGGTASANVPGNTIGGGGIFWGSSETITSLPVYAAPDSVLSINDNFELYTSTIGGALGGSICFISSDIFPGVGGDECQYYVLSMAEKGWKRLYDKTTDTYFSVGKNLTNTILDFVEISGACFLPNPYGLPDLYFSEGKLTNDLDGKGNTDKIMAMISGGSNQEITNAVDSGHFPAAELCWDYCPYGPNVDFGRHDWYLPSISELIIMFTKVLEINTSLKHIGTDYAIPVGTWVENISSMDKFDESCTYGSELLSSTISTDISVWKLDTLDGIANILFSSRNSGSSTSRIRAFIKISNEMFSTQQVTTNE